MKCNDKRAWVNKKAMDLHAKGEANSTLSGAIAAAL
jgi:hypothetical protein